MEKVSHKLAERIIARLVEKKLLTEQHGKKLLPKVAEGKVRTEDWRVAVELCGAEEAAKP